MKLPSTPFPTGEDGATALHYAATGGSSLAVGVVKLLLDAFVDVNLPDSYGNKHGDLIDWGIKPSKRKALENLLKGFAIEDGSDEEQIEEIEVVKRSTRSMYRCQISTMESKGPMSLGYIGSSEIVLKSLHRRLDGVPFSSSRRERLPA